MDVLVQLQSWAQNKTSARKSELARRAEGAREGRKGRRVATKWEGDGTEKWAVLSRTEWFVPTFLSSSGNFIEIAG